MKKTMILLSTLFLLLSLVTVTGCGGDEAQESEAIQVVTHDCEGGCGMTDMPADKTTEIDGKFYCVGCAKHLQSDDHEGHSH